jgi:hypothetical protein
VVELARRLKLIPSTRLIPLKWLFSDHVSLRFWWYPTIGARDCACHYQHRRQRESVFRVNSQPAYCKIIVSGPLTERWADYLGDLLADVEVEKGEIQTSMLIGRPPDLTAYVGMLNVLANLGFTVISAEYTNKASSREVAAPDSAEPVHR